MKCTCSRVDLNDALNAVVRAVAVKPQTPVLAAIYLRAAGDTLEFQATNFAIAIKAVIPANVESAGAAAVSGKFLAAIAAKLGGEIVTITDESATAALTLKSEAASFDLLAMDSDDFPLIRTDDSALSFRIQRNVLRNLITNTVFACSKDDSRPVFTGCLFSFAGSDATVVATNTSRIAVAKDRILDAVQPLQFIVPASALKVLSALLSADDDAVVTVSFAEGAVAFQCGAFYLSARLIDGIFPAWDKVIPASSSSTAALDRAELSRALERMLIIASHSDFQSVRLAFTDDGLTISANSKAIGSSFEHLDAVVAGAPPVLAFNISFLTDAFRFFRGKSVLFAFNSDLAPVLIHGADDDSFLYVITPLRADS